jgi:predicted  nucleic acid-binding Zn-ribbon protein
MAEADRDKANIMLADTANRNSAYKRELENHKLEANERVAFIRTLEAENIRLGKECEFLKQKNDLSSKETQKWKNDSERFSISNQILTDQLSSLKVLTNELRDKNLNLHAELNSFKDKFQNVEFERDKYRQEVRLLTNSKEFYSTLESQAEDEKDEMRKLLFRLETEIALANGSLELGRQNMLNEQRRCQQDIENKNAELRQLNAEFASLGAEHESLKALFDESTAEREALQTKLNETSEEVVKERNQVSLIRQQYKQKMAEFNSQLLAAKTQSEEIRLKAENEVLRKGRNRRYS